MVDEGGAAGERVAASHIDATQLASPVIDVTEQATVNFLQLLQIAGVGDGLCTQLHIARRAHLVLRSLQLGVVTDAEPIDENVAVGIKVVSPDAPNACLIRSTCASGDSSPQSNLSRSATSSADGCHPCAIHIASAFWLSGERACQSAYRASRVPASRDCH